MFFMHFQGKKKKETHNSNSSHYMKLFGTKIYNFGGREHINIFLSL